MSHPIPSTARADDLLRHLQDLRSGTYEGASPRGAKEVVYRQGINLLRSVAVEILEEANTLFLNGTGNVQMIGPKKMVLAFYYKNIQSEVRVMLIDTNEKLLGEVDEELGEFALEKLKAKGVEFMMKCPVTGATTNSVNAMNLS
ncbi:MAG: FAD-dependent oxidoreductase [Candidatus Nitrosopolaris sp.]|jgi:NADPH-dependent 2,4-dienoyl-CoA reductase/sulfur reductase-like enzyme